MSADGENVLFLRSNGPVDPANGLWLVERGDAAPTLLFGVDDAVAELTEAEKARREPDARASLGRRCLLGSA